MAKRKTDQRRGRRPDEDLFRDTTMTFGEHLEELRSCLFKSLVGLMIGFVFGLTIGGWVVERVQDPLKEALIAYYQTQSIGWVEEKLAELEAAGKPIPWTAEQIKQIVEEQGMLPEETFVEPSQFLRALKDAHPELVAGVDVPPLDADAKLTPDDLIRVFTWHPIEDDLRIRAKSLKPHETFLVYIKASLIVGVLLASPWIFYQIWSFVAAGLYPHEKKYIHVFLPFSLGLFLLGAAMAFFMVLEPVLDFLFYFNAKMGIDPDPRISEWLGFVLILPLGFGIAFQLPLVMLFLQRIGIFSVEVYLAKWRIAILVIAVLSMFLTPADPYSMMLMAMPLTVLYFGGILLCHYLPRKRSEYDDWDDDDRDEMPKSRSEPDEPKRGRLWFYIRLLILAVLVVVVLGYRPWRKARAQKAAVAAIEGWEGKVVYDFQLDESGQYDANAEPPGPGALRDVLGIDFMADVVEVDLTNSDVDDDCVDVLLGLGSLKKLNLTGTNVTAEGLEKLEEALPEGCQIVGPG